MKSVIAREVLWFIVALLLAVPLGFAFLWLLDLTSAGSATTEAEKDFLVELYLIGCLLGFLGVYLMRLVAMLIKTAAAGQ